MVVSPLKDAKELFSSSFHLLPHHLTTENFAYAFSHYRISNRFVNSTLSPPFGISIGEIIASILAAYSHTKYNGRYFLFFIAPFQVTMIPNYVLISRFRPLGTLRTKQTFRRYLPESRKPNRAHRGRMHSDGRCRERAQGRQR